MKTLITALTVLGLSALLHARLTAQTTEAPAVAPVVEQPKRIGDMYTLDKCPVSGESLVAGEAVVEVVAGRELRFCCKKCFAAFEQEPAKYTSAVDRRMAQDQRELYPLTTCLVSGDSLLVDGKDSAHEVVRGNRLFRLCCKDCVAGLEKEFEKHLTLLDRAARTGQLPGYPLDACLTEEGGKLGSMGEPHDLVVSGRLVRLCCSGCLAALEKDPRAHLAKLDAAWARKRAEKEAEPR